MRAVRPEPSPAVLMPGLTAGISEVSRFSCMKLPGVSGVYDYAGLNRDLRFRPVHVAFRRVNSVSVLIASFRSSIPSPPVPLLTLRSTPRDAPRKARGRVVRYSFLVGLFHSLLHAGLSRRSDSACWRQLRFSLRIARQCEGAPPIKHKRHPGNTVGSAASRAGVPEIGGTSAPGA
jgi:hypothetical protein